MLDLLFFTIGHLHQFEHTIRQEAESIFDCVWKTSAMKTEYPHFDQDINKVVQQQGLQQFTNTLS